jgi:hypothetical protein
VRGKQTAMLPCGNRLTVVRGDGLEVKRKIVVVFVFSFTGIESAS